MTESFKIAGIGEVLFDILPEGKKLGGAPVNFTFHAKQLGLNAFPVSSVGRDNYGFEIINRLKDAILSTEFIQQDDYPTGTAHVSIDISGDPNFGAGALAGGSTTQPSPSRTTRGAFGV